MRDPPGHIAPGRHPLRRDQIRHIIKGNHVALKPFIIIPTRCNAYQQIFLLSISGQTHLLLGTGLALSHRVQERLEFWYNQR